MKQFIKKTAAAAIASCIVCGASAAVCAIEPAASIGVRLRMILSMQRCAL